MVNNKLSIKYKKKNDCFIIQDNKSRVIWCLDYSTRKSLLIYKSILQNTDINMSNQIEKNNFFFKNINTFGLFPLNNINEFN